MGKPNKKLEAWMATLPAEDIPQVRLWKLATDPTLPKSLQIQAWEILCRYFGPILSSSVQKTEGEVIHKAVQISRQQVLESLHAANIKSPEDLQKVLEGKKVLLLNDGGTNNDDNS